MGNRWGSERDLGGAKTWSKLLKDFYNVFYRKNILLNHQEMSLPQSSHSQLDLLPTLDVYMLIAPFFSLSIESHREEEVVQSREVKIPEEREFLLNNEEYISTTQVTWKRQCTF